MAGPEDVPETSDFVLHLPAHQMRRLRLLRVAWEEQQNAAGLKAHVDSGRPAKTFPRKPISLNDIIVRAIELFMASFDEGAAQNEPTNRG